MYSKILKQNYTVDKKAGTLTTEDGQVYNRKELKLLMDCSDEIKVLTHEVKKNFKGTVVG